MLGQRLHNFFLSRCIKRIQGRHLRRICLSPCHMTATVAHDSHISQGREAVKNRGKWIIQRDQNVFTLTSPNKANVDKQQPVWLMKYHGILMRSVTLPLPCHHKGQPICDSTSLHSYTVESLISYIWNTPKKDIEAIAHQLIRRMDSMSVEQIIAVADMFYLRKVWIPMYSVCMINFMTEMWELLTFSPSQLARLAFHMGCQGGASPDFILAFENKTLELIDDLTLNEVAIISSSFFNCEIRFKSMQLLNQISRKLLNELDSLNFSYFSVFMKIFRQSNFLNISFYSKLGNLLIEKDYLKQFKSLPQIMHIAFTYGSQRITHPELFSYILKTCIHSPGYKFRMKDVGKMVWSCGTLIVNKPEDLKNIEQLVRIAMENISLHETIQFPDNLVDICMGLCHLNVYLNFLISKVFSPECVPNILRLGVDRERFFQLNFIHHSVQIENSSYEGYMLDEETQQVISSKIAEFPLHMEFAQKKGLKQTLIATQQLVGYDKVVFRRILPHLQYSDIIVVWDKSRSCFVNENSVPSDDSDMEDKRFIKLDIIVTSLMQTTFDIVQQPLGMFHTRLRQLGVLGYQTLQITPEEATRIQYGTSQESIDLLKKKIETALRINL